MDDGAGGQTIDLTKSIYSDWGAFITAILNFFIIALTLFIILRVAMKTRGYLEKAAKARPTKAERKILKEQGVNMRDYGDVIKATAELREKNKPAPVAPKPTQEELLTQILEELKKNNQTKTSEAIVEATTDEKTEEKADPPKSGDGWGALYQSLTRRQSQRIGTTAAEQGKQQASSTE